MNETEKALAHSVHALTESLGQSFKLQAGLCRILAQAIPASAKGFEAAASGIEECASNLTKNLPKLPDA